MKSIPTREAQLKKLRSDHFDLLIIGGGATGTGVALDAALRGLHVALVEADDFASGTSSRSTKLIHGGLRYLEQAIKRVDFSQFGLIAENLKERHTLLHIAPHIVHPLPILIPIYRWHELFYYYPGVKLYDLLAKDKKLGQSHFVSKQTVLQQIPHLKRAGLKGGLVVYDGQFDDARMNVTLALTAASKGATVANHVAVIGLLKENGLIRGAVVKDNLSGRQWEIKSRIIVNATGPFADTIRRMDDPAVAPAIRPSAGTHLILDKSYLSGTWGLLIPKTSDGRLLFILPWQGATLVGTTDLPTALSADPRPSEEEIAYLLHHLQLILGQPILRQAVRAAWSGLRPLLTQQGVSSTASLSREHRIEVSPTGLYSIMGGKWSSYRKMAEELVDALPIPFNKCLTSSTLLWGAEGYTPSLKNELQQRFALSEECASHLAQTYGGKALEILSSKSTKQLVEGFPYLVAEVVYAIQHEYAFTVEDILHRRTRLAFLDHAAAETAFPIVKELLFKHRLP